MEELPAQSDHQDILVINPKYIAVRDLCLVDIPYLVNYWFHSPPNYLSKIGVDPNKLPTATEFEESLKEKCRNNGLLPASKLNALVITYKEQAVGFHTLNPLVEGDFGIFHAHIWDPAMRRKGIAAHSYPKACQVFMDRFDLERILFKTPAQNIGSIRVKEKLGIRYLGEETVNFGIIKDDTLAKVFELKKEELDFLFSDIDTSQLSRNLQG